MTLLSVTIRDDDPGDRDAIRRVHRQAFPTDLEARLVDLLRDNNKASLSLVAVTASGVVGHVLFSPVTVERDTRHGLGLGPIGVAPSAQRQGVGSQLIREGLRRCSEAGYAFVVLIGDPHYYGRFGFVPGSRFGLSNEYGVEDEFMILTLADGSPPSDGGLVRYAREFSEVGPAC